ncbi:hypothetical protein INS49_002183 [Diaporthe citri]|uniref:uncharacterized protein n=1 Tax=Diaporthe citri TaxID=83186 RepID=UPI001C810F51|nr:uncharacterized protein INS49_002183 [Diaporthe citri]KAG6367983.1 hypothetical protein INS49_002183 [Diaporthe citri]
MSTSNSLPCDHPPVPALGSADLQMFSYLPGPLVEQTRAFFEAEDLLPSQLEARDNFIFLFGLQQDETYTEVTTLEELAEHLDAFFFAGLLTGVGGGRRILRCLELEQDIFTAAPPTCGHGSYGDVHTSMPLGESRLEVCPSGEWAITISINPNNQDGLPAPLHSLLEALVHEMVRSFLQSFICSRGSCQAERTVALDPTHYRPLFVELLDSITSAIREWDKDLAAFYLLEDSANV